MAEHIKIADIAPRIQQIATGSQTHFDYPFPIFDADDLQVYLDDVRQTSGFEVHDAGNSSGGTLTFDSPPASGAVVTLYRQIPIERTTDFLRSAPLTPDALNDDLDYLTVAVQQVEDDAGRSLHLGVTDDDANLVLPAKAERADKLLAFDADGNVTTRSEGVGITDHGALTGLGDDDHPQYHTDPRADSWLTSKTLDDIGAGIANHHFTAADQAKLAGVETGAQVNTVTDAFGRTGAVAAAAGDYAASQVDNDGTAPGTTVAEALDRLNTDKAANADLATHAADTGNPHGVTKGQVGLGNVADLKVKLDAITDPSPNDGASGGFAVGSRWVNVATDKEFVCVDAAGGAAVWRETTQGGGTASDHGSLAGLGDDDHPQYHTDARADGWLATKTSDDVAEGTVNRYMTLAGSGSAAAAARSDHDHTGTYAASSHTHPGLVPSGGSTGQILAKRSSANHDTVWQAEPAPGEVNTASNVNVGGIGVFKQKVGNNLEFRGVMAGSSRISMGLSAATNEIDLDVSEANLNLANIGGSLGSNAAHGVRGGGGLHATATTATGGFMSPADKAKLDGIEPGAETNAVTTVFGRTGAIAAAVGDYAASQIANDGAAPGKSVGEALDQLDADKAASADLATHTADTANPHAVTKAQLGIANVPDLKLNLKATADPTATDDSKAGYAVGSRWVNTVTDTEFVCVDATNGTAAWKETTAQAGGAGAIASVFGRTGAIAAQAGDYAASQLANDSAITGTTVANALETLEAEIHPPPTTPPSAWSSPPPWTAATSSSASPPPAR